MKTYPTLDAAFLGELAHILDNGYEVSPRGLPSLECTDSVFRIANPRSRLIFNPVRRWSIAYAIGEFCWHASGSDQLEFIAHYSQRWRQVSGDGRTIRGSCYGFRLFSGQGTEVSPWDRIRQLLAKDPDTRRAILPFFTMDDLSVSTEAPDVPCTVTLHFMVREGRLCLSNFMRSNDIMMGFGYDIFFFTMLQELMACQLGLDVGWYQHMVGSIHLYRDDYDRASRIRAHRSFDTTSQMQPMAAPEELLAFLQFERLIRQSPPADPSMTFPVHPYWARLLTVLLFHKLRRLGDDTGMRLVLARLGDEPFARLLDQDTRH
jgi:thymidylate synthase